jgi:MFS family permease
MTRHPSRSFALIVFGTVLGIAGTDLVLPAVPMLPDVLGGTAEGAQLVLAAFTGGAGAGLLLFGALGARYDQRSVLVGALLCYALVSALCAFSPGLDALIGLRVLQGVASAAPAVFAPGMIRALFGDARAVSALGLLGSVESLTPALAPVAGVWLLRAFGWNGSFEVLAALALLLAGVLLAARDALPPMVTRAKPGGYLRILRDIVFLRFALSQAWTLGALLVFVFGAPAVFIHALGADLASFIRMQMIGVALFIVAATCAGRLVARFGARRMVIFGSVLGAVGALAILAYALAGGRDTLVISCLFPMMNVGLGLRGPAGFHAAVVAAHDDARGSALVILAILGTASLGTAAVAPLIAHGLVPLAAAAAVLAVGSVLLVIGPGLFDPQPSGEMAHG